MTTDFGPIRGIALSYPSDFEDPFYRSLTPFYNHLLSVLPDNLRVALIVSHRRSVDTIREAFPNREFQVIVVDNFNEIWLRDILGFPAGNSVIKTEFRPTYFKAIYTDSYLTRLHSQAESILHALGFEVNHIALAWDGGNLIHNNTIGFITDKLLRDNSRRKESEIRKLIENHLGIAPVFIPTAQNDQLAHSDGYLNFISETQIVVSNYPDVPFLREARKYSQRLHEIVQAENLQVVEIWDRPFSETVKVDNEFLESSRGIYNNFIQMNSELILPAYKAPTKAILSTLLEVNKNTLGRYFTTVHTVNADHLARLGGVLHCVSWCW